MLTIAVVLFVESIRNVHILVLYSVNTVTFILISVEAERSIKGLQISYVEEYWLLVGFLAHPGGGGVLPQILDRVVLQRFLNPNPI